MRNAPRPAEDHYTHVIRGIDPIEDIDDFRPERGIHRIDLLGSVDHDSGNLVCQLYAGRLCIRSRYHPRQQAHGNVVTGAARTTVGNYNNWYQPECMPMQTM